MSQMNLLRVASVAKKLDMGTSSIWKLLKRDPSFPKPFKVSEHVDATVWVEHELDEWLLTRMQSRSEQAGFFKEG